MKTTVQHLFFTLSFVAICFAINAQSIELVPYASGFDKPVDISNAGDNRLFVTEKGGVIKIVSSNGVVLTTPFLDIDSRVNSAAGERGLLGLVFHPDYENNGYFYVNYTGLDGTTHISRFSLGDTPNVADPDSELILFAIEQPANNHNAGDLNFGPDGYLYFGLGDGGGGGDQWNNSQNPQTALGKMIRIDVDNPMPNLNYGIPADNPFVGDATTIDEIWALGLRNPWRFSFDSETGDMWIADVGQDELEEIDFQAAASSGGENYGWRCYEGDEPFNTSGCPDESTFVAPIHVYQNGFSTGCSVTGGFVYRGTTQLDLYGKYIYADYCSGRFWSLSSDGTGGWINEDLGNFVDEEFSTFGEDNNGELYVAAIGEGEIYRIGDNCSAFKLAVNEMDICDGSGTLGSASVGLNNAVFPVDIMWSNAATAGEITDLAEGTYSVTVTDANDCLEVVEFDINTVSVPTPLIFMTADENLEVESAANYPDSQFTWYLDGEIVALESCGAQQWCVQPTESGVYMVCTDYAFTTATCSACSASFNYIYTNTENIAAIDEIQISPIPTNDILTINLTTNEKVDMQIKLQNVHGQILIEKEESISGNWNTSLNVSYLPSGTYFLTLQSGNEIMTKKVLKY